MKFVRFDPAPALAGFGIVGLRGSGGLAIGLGPSGPETRRRDRYGTMALLAAREALEDAGLADGDWRGERCGVMIGTTHASAERNGRYAIDLASGAPGLSPSLFVRTTSGAAAADVAYAFRMGGPGQTFASGWTSGAEALAAGARAVARGAADLVLAGAVEAPGPIFAHAGPFTAEAAAMAVVQSDAPADRPRLLAYGRGRGADSLEAIASEVRRECGLDCSTLVEANDRERCPDRGAGSPLPRGARSASFLSVQEQAGPVGAAGAVIGCALCARSGGPALVVARDPAGDLAALVLG